MKCDLVHFKWVRLAVWVDRHELIELLSTQLILSFPEQLLLIRFKLFAQLLLRSDDTLKVIEVRSRFKFEAFLELQHTFILGPDKRNVVHGLVKDRHVLGLHLLKVSFADYKSFWCSFLGLLVIRTLREWH